MDDNVERAKAFFSKFNVVKKDASRVKIIEDGEEFEKSKFIFN
jgi:hypothetical protein